jgi:hypothetical protein
MVAIVISELVDITLKDVSTRVEGLGYDAIRQRLSAIIVEKILSQDLEDFERNNKTDEYGSSNDAQRLLHSFPIRKFLDIPATLLRTISKVTTTGFMLWTKNWYLFSSVMATILIQRTLRNRFRDFQHSISTYLDVYGFQDEADAEQKVTIFEVRTHARTHYEPYIHTMHGIRSAGKRLCFIPASTACTPRAERDRCHCVRN